VSSIVQYAVLSIGAAGIYAVMAQGIVLVYRGSGVLNLAQGSMLMFAAFVFHDLRDRMSFGPAYACSILVVSAIGLVFYWLVMRPLKGASLLAQIIATLGLIVVLVNLAFVIYGTDAKTANSVLPDRVVSVFGTDVGLDRVLVLALAAASTAVLWAVYRFTTVGLATSAVAENERGAAILGWSPNMIAGASWLAAAALAGAAGPLVAPVLGPLDANILTLLVVPGLAVALVGGFRSFPGAFLGAVGLAALELNAQFNIGNKPGDWSGLEKAVPLVAIVLVLVLRGRGLPGRGFLAERRPALGSGRVVWPVVLPIVALGFLSIVTWMPADWVDALSTHLSLAVVLLSLVVLIGYTGQLSLGQFAFAGFAALISGRLIATQQGFSFPLAVLLGVAGAVAIGLVFALPALRTRGLNLAIVTLGLGVAFDALLFQRAYFSPLAQGQKVSKNPFLGSLAKRREGTIVGTQHLFGMTFDKITHPRTYAAIAYVVLVLLTLAVASLRRGRAGRRLIAVRTNERAAASLGISVASAKLYAFGLSAGIAGIGGILIAFQQGKSVTYGRDFVPFRSIVAVAFAVIGGIGYVIGPLFGALFLPGTLGASMSQDLSEWLNDPTLIRPWLAALLVGGLAAGIAVLVRRFVRRFGGRVPAWTPVAAAAAGGVVGALAAASVGTVLGHVNDSVTIAPWLGALIAGLLAAPVARGASRRLGITPRQAWWAGFAGVVVLSRVFLGDRMASWLQDLQTYMGLIGGVLLLALMRHDPDGIAAIVVRRARALMPLWPSRAPAAIDLDAADLDTRELDNTEGEHHRVAPKMLEVRDLTVRFGAVTAADGITFAVGAGEVVGLIGPNGAGKTSVVDSITGFLGIDEGEIRLDGVDVAGLAPHRRARLGVSRSFQNLELFEDLTVLENIASASDRRDVGAYFTGLFSPGRNHLTSTARVAIREFELAGDLHRRVSELPYGRRRLVAVARAVATRPSVLLLDEPAAGLDEHESREFARLVRRLADEWGIGVLVIEHDMAFIMGVCDRVVVIDFGVKIAEGTPAAIQGDPLVVAAYLGDLDEHDAAGVGAAT